MIPLEERKKVSDFFEKGYTPTSEQKEFAMSVLNYRKAGIYIEEMPSDNDDGITRTVKITQKKLINGYILNQKTLVEMVKEVYKPLGYETKVIPVVYSLQVDEIDETWIENKMIEFGIKRNDLVKQLALDKSYISLLFADESNNRKIHLSKPMKATFFYYFLTYELNRDLREQINNKIA